jgi:hypothetical protein
MEACRVFRIQMDESLWRLLNQYTAFITELVKGRYNEKRPLRKDQVSRTSLVVNAIVAKFLIDNSERIQHVVNARKARRSIRAIRRPEPRARASAAARRSFPVQFGGPAKASSQKGVV